MRARLRRGVAAALICLAASLSLVTTTIAAPSWTPAMDLRVKTNIELGDADFDGTDVSVVWQEPTSNGPRVGLRSSSDSGANFLDAHYYSFAREPAVDICPAGSLDIAYSQKTLPGQRNIFFSQTEIEQIGFSNVPVDLSTTKQHDPDVACAGGRVFVTWYNHQAGGDELFVAHSDRQANFDPPVDLGFDDETVFFNSLAVAGVSDMAYVAYQTSDDDLHLMRFAVGGGPAHNVTNLGSRVIRSATNNQPASYAVIDAEGSKVAVSWFECSGIYARVSNDHGATWGPVRTLMDDFNSCESDAAAAQNSIAIEGSRMAVTYGVASAFGGGEIRLIRTTNNFATFSDVAIVNNFQPEHLVGYVSVGANARLAAAFQKADTVRFRRQI